MSSLSQGIKLSGLRVLIAEDDTNLAKLLGRQLEELGLTVIGIAADGEKAITLAEALTPDLLLLDLGLPKMDGIQVAREILDQRFFPVVVVTGKTGNGVVETVAELGVSAYLIKPFQVHELEAAITIAFAQYSRIRLLQDEVGSLQEALETRKLVERAKGILMDRFGLSEGDAMRRLQQESKDRNMKLGEIARTLVTAHETFASLDKQREPTRRHSQNNP
ncbi:MAG TPA: response regulator [Methylomirabilota bacterium]|nr:response regulator [Methylomirabilota bacterium]